MLAALLAMGVHSTFFGPIKYAILPQHLKREEVLAGTGLVEAGTYVAILAGTILAGWLQVEWAACAILVVAVAGYLTRSEAGRVGKECVSTCRSRGSATVSKKKKIAD